MNILTVIERDRYFESFKKELKAAKLNDVELVLCTPSVHLEQFAKKLKTKIVSVGAQNIFWEDRGSYTGEISAPMIKNFGCEYVIVGHSERRRYFGENDEQANAKIKAALKSGLRPIFCVGETKEDRMAGNTAEVIVDQVSKGLEGISSAKASSVVIAYEPVWAVGSDLTPTSDEILEIKILLRKILTQLYGTAVAEKIKVLYGGSVNAKSVQLACVEPGMDGVLVGRESLIPRELIKIAEIIDKN